MESIIFLNIAVIAMNEAKKESVKI